MECECDEYLEEKEGREMQQGVGCRGRWVRGKFSWDELVERHEGESGWGRWCEYFKLVSSWERKELMPSLKSGIFKKWKSKEAIWRKRITVNCCVKNNWRDRGRQNNTTRSPPPHISSYVAKKKKKKGFWDVVKDLQIGKSACINVITSLVVSERGRQQGQSQIWRWMGEP